MTYAVDQMLATDVVWFARDDYHPLDQQRRLNDYQQARALFLSTSGTPLALRRLRARQHQHPAPALPHASPSDAEHPIHYAHPTLTPEEFLTW